MRSVVALLVASASSRPLDLDPAIRRFLVLTQPRSGSTWFCKYSANLAAFAGVVTAGEALHPESVQRYRSRTGRNADPDASLAGYLAYVADSAKFPTSKAPISAVFHSFWLIFGRAIISRNGLEAWMLFPERARAEHSR